MLKKYKVKIWDTEKKVEVYTFTEHAGIITSVKFHPDGTCLASASHDRKIKVFFIPFLKFKYFYIEKRNRFYIKKFIFVFVDFK